MKKGYAIKKQESTPLSCFLKESDHKDLFAPVENPKQQKLSLLLDAINHRFGKNQIFYGSYGTKRDWLPRDILRSPRYTTEYREILTIL